MAGNKRKVWGAIGQSWGGKYKGRAREKALHHQRQEQINESIPGLGDAEGLPRNSRREFDGGSERKNTSEERIGPKGQF